MPGFFFWSVLFVDIQGLSILSPTHSQLWHGPRSVQQASLDRLQGVTSGSWHRIVQTFPSQNHRNKLNLCKVESQKFDSASPIRVTPYQCSKPLSLRPCWNRMILDSPASRFGIAASVPISSGLKKGTKDSRTCNWSWSLQTRRQERASGPMQWELWEAPLRSFPLGGPIRDSPGTYRAIPFRDSTAEGV